VLIEGVLQETDKLNLCLLVLYTMGENTENCTFRTRASSLAKDEEIYSRARIAYRVAQKIGTIFWRLNFTKY